MARKKTGQEPMKGINTEVILQKTMESVMHASMMPYSEHVILDRALPRVEDGLKPVQRRILYTMQELALSPDSPTENAPALWATVWANITPTGIPPCTGPWREWRRIL